MSFGPIVVDPSAKEYFSETWSDRLGTDTISTGTWSINPNQGGTAITFSGGTIIGGTKIAVFGTGFSVGEIYNLAFKITSVGGISDERTITFRCENL